MSDVSDFYLDGFRRFGLASEGLPLERADGKLVIHLVRGQLPARKYDAMSGGRTAKEIQAALKPMFDTAREHVLVFYACGKTDDGRFTFHTPHYGSGSQRNGICHAADCDWLDPLWLKDTNQTIVLIRGPTSIQNTLTLARFNTWYLGGVAHELGHCFGLLHDNGGQAEASFGVSLMGMGNLTYREEVWGGGPPTYLGRASVLQLLSEPIFTGSNRGRWDLPPKNFSSLKFSETNGTVRIEGIVIDTVPAYAVIAYVWPDSDQVDDHCARTFPCVVRDGRFILDLTGLKADHWRHFHLRLSKLHVNGGAVKEEFALSYDSSSTPEIAGLNAEWRAHARKFP